ncbi:MAG TPA: NAD(+) synthase [Flavobacteriales bacterium]
MHTEAVIAHIVAWLKDYLHSSRQNGFVVGVSGGIDSAVVSALCARTGAPVHCLEMPIHQAPSQVERAQRHIALLMQRHPNVSMRTVQLTGVFDAFVAALEKGDDVEQTTLALANTRSRLRMTALYYYAGLHRALVAGTGNKVEDFGVGFFTKYGDGGVDLSPIADLYKSEVYELGRVLGVGEDIMKAAPTDGLWGDDRSDADQIGASYPELEWAMALRAGNGDTAGLSERQRKVLDIYDLRHAANLHKMVPIPVCIIPAELKS